MVSPIGSTDVRTIGYTNEFTIDDTWQSTIGDTDSHATTIGDAQ
jgi:hypothetical protein